MCTSYYLQHPKQQQVEVESIQPTVTVVTDRIATIVLIVFTMWHQCALRLVHGFLGPLKSSPETALSVGSAFCRPYHCAFSAFCLQCFDAVGWAAGRASGL